jgi:chromosome segregation ATPase
MPIKLLPKHEVTRLQANERRVSIEEGLKLARRVDALRETIANEEASLASFRVSTLKAIHQETAEATKERDLVLSQVLSLRKELQEGHSSLDTRTSELELVKEALEARETVLNKRIAALDKLAIAVDKREKASNTLQNRLKNAWKVIDDMGKESAAQLEEAKTALQTTRKQIDAMSATVIDVENQLRNADIGIASRERDVTIKEERLNNKENELRKAEILLRDREQTLEREFNRLNKKHEPNSPNPKL